MSFLSKLVKSALPVVAGAIPGGSAALSIFQAAKGENIANKLSRQVGCTIPQRSAPQARALLEKGINPCTGQTSQPIAPVQSSTRVSVPGTVTGILGRVLSIAPGQPTGGLVFNQKTGEWEAAPTPGYAGNVPLEILKTPVQPSKTVEFGAMSMIQPTASMASVTAVANLAGRAIFTAAVKRKILRVVRAVGIQTAATILGLGIADVAQVVANPPRRRRKGITGAQLANAKRVNRAVMNMANELSCSCAKTPRRTTRRRTCRS